MLFYCLGESVAIACQRVTVGTSSSLDFLNNLGSNCQHIEAQHMYWLKNNPQQKGQLGLEINKEKSGLRCKTININFFNNKLYIHIMHLKGRRK